MRKTLKVRVTREDIKKGKPQDPRCCPIARAFKRAHPKATRVVVDYDCINWNYRKRMWSYRLDDSVLEFINDFDEGGGPAVKPGFIEIPLKEVERG